MNNKVGLRMGVSGVITETFEYSFCCGFIDIWRLFLTVFLYDMNNFIVTELLKHCNVKKPKYSNISITFSSFVLFRM